MPVHLTGQSCDMDKILNIAKKYKAKAILTSQHQIPNQAWLKIVKTSKAITHIKRVLKREEENKSIDLGKEIL